MIECSVCADDTDDARVTPCCKTALCVDCGKFDNAIETSATERPRCRASGCSRSSIADVAGWDAVLASDDLERLRTQVARFNQPQVVQPAITGPSDNDRRNAAWTAGSYVHGCGTAYGITDGCDVVKCPGCDRLVNITGGQPGAHTFYFERFFAAIKGLSAANPASALNTIKSAHPEAWQSLFLDDLVETVKKGDPGGQLGKMLDVVWGPFVAFLRARILPDTRPALDTTSLRTLYSGACADQALLADATILYELFSNRDASELGEQRRRREIRSRLTDNRLKDALLRNMPNSSWWQ